MSGARRGSIIAATWLIGLGIVFLVRQATGLPWGQAWPMFVILAGVAGLISTVLAWRPSVAGLWAFTGPVVLIVAGSVLLASTTGQLDEGPLELIEAWWPYAAIGLGVWLLIGAIVPGRRPVDRLAVALAGASQAAVRIQYGAGRLAVGRAAPGNLVDGTFEGGVRQDEVGPGRVSLAQDTEYGLPWLDHEADWSVGVTGEVPLDLRVDTGASRTLLDLAEVRLRRLELHTGASETRVRLPKAAGASEVRAETGAASLVIEVPVGVAARIRARMALGTTQVDEARFPRVGDGYVSPDYTTAADRVDIDVEGGVGSVRVVSGA